MKNRLPEKPGFYWWRHKKHRHWLIMEVEWRGDHLVFSHAEDIMYRELDSENSEWGPRIKEPKS